MDPTTLTIIGLIVVPVISAVTGYLLKTLMNDKITANKATADRMIEQVPYGS